MNNEHLQVKKDNSLILSKGELSLHEEKLFAYLVSQIQPGDGDFYEQAVTPDALIKQCNIPKSNVYPKVKKIAKDLSKQSLEVIGNDGEWMYIPLMFRSRWSPNDKKFYFTLHPDLRIRLLDLRASYTQYSLGFITGFRSRYSIKIYEMCIMKLKQSKRPTVKFDITIDQIKELFGIAGMYKAFSIFNKTILEKPIKEINKNTDIRVKYICTKQGRSYHRIIFEVERSLEMLPDIVQTLITTAGVRVDKAIELFRNFGADHITAKLREWGGYLLTKQFPNGDTMKSPSGFIISQIEDGDQTSIDDYLRQEEERISLAEMETEEREKQEKMDKKLEMSVKSTKNGFQELQEKLKK